MLMGFVFHVSQSYLKILGFFFFFKHDGHGIFSHILTVSAQTLRNAIIISYYPEATGILGLKGSKEDFSRFLKRKDTKAV